MREQVVAALVGLGWAQKQAETAVDAAVQAAVEAAGGQAGAAPEEMAHDPADLLRTALRGLARS
jgi:Holliday junction resolvasome RuvABC DNA-binding subunit